MVSKKSQITLFIILGMVVLMIFGIATYIVKTSSTSKVKEESQKILTETIQVSGLRSYVEQCLDQTAEEALLRLGRQGGNLYKFQGGNMVPLKSPLEVNNNNISYAITKPSLAADSAYPPPWRYPFIGPLSITNYYAYLGNSPFPGLCDQFGANKPGARFFLPCPTYDTNLTSDKTSVQEQLQMYVANKTKNCINFSAIPGIQGNIKEGDMNVTVSFGRNNVEFALKYPLEIKIAGKQPVVELLSFNTKQPARLMKIFEISQNIINRDNSEILFKVNEKEEDLQGFDRYISIGLFERLCTDCGNEKYDTLLQIQDSNSIINNTPYVFQFMIENRNPILEWIGRYPEPEDYNIIVLEGDTLNFTVQGYDPDDLDLLEYKYIGWKQDYDEVFDYAQFESDRENDLILAPESYIQMVTSTKPNHWMIDDNYPEKFPNSSYYTKKEDVGEHNLTIEVRDEAGLKDWQDLRILVADKPVIKAEAERVYPDIPENIASVEDYFQLNGRYFSAFTTVLDAFWTDMTTNKVYTNMSQKIPEGEIDIKDIKTAEFNTEGIHNFKLTAETDYAGTVEELLDIDVKVCVPHRDDDLIYPYNSGDPFQANHTCCTDSYGLNTNYICYEESYLTCKPERKEMGSSAKAVIDNANNVIDADLSDPEFMAIDRESDPNSANDIYQRTFTQECGQRGNICSGDVEDIWTRITECADLTGSETERCQGPAENIDACDTISSQLCYNYYSTTFEKEFEKPGATGICNPVPECSSPLDSERSYDDGGYIKCQATCYFGTCSKPINCVCGDCPGTGSACNGKVPGSLSGQCDGAGEKYFEDICTERCSYQDTTSGIFECNKPGCECNTPECNGLSSDSELDRCDLGGKTYFLDKCDSQATAVDKDNYCNADSSKGCTGAHNCHGLLPLTELQSCTNADFFRDVCSTSCNVESIQDKYVTKILSGCSGPKDCHDVDRFQVKPGKGWCYDDGTNLNICTSSHVDVNENGIPDSGDACGCSGHLGKPCDENFDGKYGVCDTYLGVGCCTDVNDLIPGLC